ncbi:hypothetical protein COEX109129_41330 [Corallococcus exiguus]
MIRVLRHVLEQLPQRAHPVDEGERADLVRRQAQLAGGHPAPGLHDGHGQHEGQPPLEVRRRHAPHLVADQRPAVAQRHRLLRGQVPRLEGERAGLRTQRLAQDAQRPLRQLRERRRRLEQPQPEQRREQVASEALLGALRLLELLRRQEPRAHQRHAQRVLRVRRVHVLRAALAEVDRQRAVRKPQRQQARLLARGDAPIQLQGRALLELPLRRHRVGPVIRRRRRCLRSRRRSRSRARCSRRTGRRDRRTRRPRGRDRTSRRVDGRTHGSRPGPHRARARHGRPGARTRDRGHSRARHGHGGRTRDGRGRAGWGWSDGPGRGLQQRRGRAVAPQLPGERVPHLREAPREGELQAIDGDLDLALDGAAVDEQLDGRARQGPPGGAPIVPHPVLPDLALRHVPSCSQSLDRREDGILSPPRLASKQTTAHERPDGRFRAWRPPSPPALRWPDTPRRPAARRAGRSSTPRYRRPCRCPPGSPRTPPCRTPWCS